MIVRDFSTLRTLGYRAAHSTIKTVNISAYLGKEIEVKMPSSVAHIKVKSISSKAFAECDAEVVHLPERLMLLEEDVFKDSKVVEVHVNSLLLEVSDLGKSDITFICPADSLIIPQLKKLKIKHKVDSTKEPTIYAVAKLVKLATVAYNDCSYVNCDYLSETKTKLYVKLKELNIESEHKMVQYTLTEDGIEMYSKGKVLVDTFEVIKYIAGKYQIEEGMEEVVGNEIKPTSIFGNSGAMASVGSL